MTMKRILAGALALTLLGGTAADASPWHHGGWGHGGGHWGGGWGRGGWGWGPVAAVVGLGAFVVGTAIGSAANDRDRYYGGDDNYGPPPPPNGYYNRGGYNGGDGYYGRGAPPQGSYRGAPPNDSYRGDDAPRTAPNNGPSPYDDGGN